MKRRRGSPKSAKSAQSSLSDERRKLTPFSPSSVCKSLVPREKNLREENHVRSGVSRGGRERERKREREGERE